MVDTSGILEVYLNHSTGLPATPTVVTVGSVRIGRYRSLNIHVFSDVNCTIDIQFSNDGLTFATIYTASMAAHVTIGDIHITKVKGEYVRLLFANTTGVPGVVFESKTYAIPINSH